MSGPDGAEPDAIDTPDGPLPRPRIRVGAAVWGVILSSAALSVTLIGADDTRREAFLDWLLALTPTAMVLIVLLAIGATVLLVGVLALVAKPSPSRRRGTESETI